MKIKEARCDQHTQSVLLANVIETLSTVGDRNKLETMRCEIPDCDRHYRRDFGYFRSRVGENLDILTGAALKPRCGLNHHVEHMALTELNGNLVWACPVPACNHTEPFQQPN